MKSSNKEPSEKELNEFFRETDRNIVVNIEFDDKTAERLVGKPHHIFHKDSQTQKSTLVPSQYEPIKPDEIMFLHNLEFHNHNKRFKDRHHPHGFDADLRKSREKGSLITLRASSHGDLKHGKETLDDLIKWINENLPNAKIVGSKVREPYSLSDLEKHTFS